MEKTQMKVGENKKVEVIVEEEKIPSNGESQKDIIESVKKPETGKVPPPNEENENTEENRRE